MLFLKCVYEIIVTHLSCSIHFQFALKYVLTLHKKATIDQVTTMQATSKNVVFLFFFHNHLLTTGTDDPTL